MDRRILAFLASMALTPAAALCQESPIRVGVMNDLSGPYSDFQGIGSVIAAQMAVEDYGGKAAGRRLEVVSADHQNKPDIGSAIAGKWLDTEGVSMIIDLPNSAVALAVSEVVRDKNKVMIGSGAGTAALTGEKCSPNTVHWTYDTWSYGHALAHAVMERGGKTWFFITADYAFGHDLEKQVSDQVMKEGGAVLGTARHPIGNADFSSFLLKAQASGAQVIALANAGADETNTIKQASEFGLMPKQSVVGLIFGLNNVPALGLKAAQGLMTVFPFYWDMNEAARAWAQRFQQRHPRHNMPNDMQAGVYAGVLHYLKAVDKVRDADNGKAVVAAMKELPTEDPLFGTGTIRADGRKIHPMYLFEVKAPQQSKSEWDVFKLLATIPADAAFRPLAAGGCPLVSQ